MHPKSEPWTLDPHTPPAPAHVRACMHLRPGPCTSDTTHLLYPRSCTLCTLVPGPWTVDRRHHAPAIPWILDPGPRALYPGPWTLDPAP